MSGSYVEFDYKFPNSKKAERIGKIMFNSPVAYNKTLKFINEIRKIVGDEQLSAIPVYVTSSDKIVTPVEAFTGCEIDGNYLILNADDIDKSYVKKNGHLCSYWKKRYVVFMPKKLGRGAYEFWFNVDSGKYAIPIPSRVIQFCDAVREAVNTYGKKRVVVISTESGIEIVRTNKIMDLNLMRGEECLFSCRMLREETKTPMIRRRTFSGSYMQRI